MPIYEYICLDCKTRFEALRSMKDADAPILCKECDSERTSRAITVFFAQSGGRIVAGNSNSCGSCAGGSCASCGSNN